MQAGYFHKFTDNETKSFLVVYQRQGNDKNGNPIYIINIFDGDNITINLNYKTDRRRDKYGNIKTTSYNIENTIQSIINEL